MLKGHDIELKAKFTVVYLIYSEGFIHPIQQLSIENLLSLVFLALYSETKGAFQKSELAGRTMAAPLILKMK